MQDEIESTLDQIELNIGNLEHMEKLEIPVWEDGIFCDHLLSIIMLSAILNVNHSQKSQMVEPWQLFLLCLVMTTL